MHVVVTVGKIDHHRNSHATIQSQLVNMYLVLNISSCEVTLVLYVERKVLFCLLICVNAK